MRAAPPPKPLPRTAAIQQSSKPPSGPILTRGKGRSTSTLAIEREFLSTYNDWQTEARRAARKLGPARFTANMVAETAGRVRLVVEQENPSTGDWAEVENDDFLAGIMADYHNQTLGQGSGELSRLHAWHYQVAGEAALVVRDGQYGGSEWFVVSMRAIDWDRPTPGMATVMLTPGGTVLEGQAFVVPRDQVLRFWWPDEEWLGLAVSPMTAGMDDLHRYKALVRYARRQAENYLAMAGMLWTPSEAHEGEQDPDDMASGPQMSALFQKYQEWASIAMDGDDQLQSVVPPMFWWPNDLKPPEWIDLGRGGLDEAGMDHRREALTDFARAADAPASLIVDGGGAEGSHWNEWLTEERFHAAVAPTLNRMTHQDLTIAYLLPRMRLHGGYQDLTRYRVGYDATEVVIHPDKSDKALRGWLSGLLDIETTLREMGFDPDNQAKPEDLERLAAVLSNFANGVPGVGGGGGEPGQTPATRSEPGPAVPGGAPVDKQSLAARTEKEPPALAASMRDAALEVLLDYLPQPAINVRTNGNGRGPSSNGNGQGRTAASKADEYADGVMLYLPVPGARELSVEGGEPPESMHLTLAVIDGDVGDLDPELRDRLGQIAAGLAVDWSPPLVNLTRVEQFDPGDDGLAPTVLREGGPDVAHLRARAADALRAAGVPFKNDWVPYKGHVTLGYWPEGEGPAVGALDDPVVFAPRTINVAWGPEVDAYEFGAPVTAAALVAHMQGEHDQKDHGRGRGGGGDSGGKGKRRKKAEGGGGKVEPKGTGTADDPVQCGDDLDLAVEMLNEGKHVTLNQPDEVSTLIDKLGEMAKDAEAKGEEAPNYNLCNVSVPGTNLFCHDNLDINRINMPQMTGKPRPGSPADKLPRDQWGDVSIGQAFADHMKSLGYTVTERQVDPSHLRASQNELVGPKVATIMGRMRAGTQDRSAPIFTTRSNYVVDGHHRWAAEVGLDLVGAGGTMPVLEIDADIGTVLTIANYFADEQGILPKAATPAQ